MQAVKAKFTMKDMALTYNKTFALRFSLPHNGVSAIVEVSLRDTCGSGLQYVCAHYSNQLEQPTRL